RSAGSTTERNTASRVALLFLVADCGHRGSGGWRVLPSHPAYRVVSQLQGALQFEFSLQVSAVGIDGLDAHVKCLGDFMAAFSAPDQFEDFKLTVGQPFQGNVAALRTPPG